MSIKRIMFDTLVVLSFLGTTGLLFNHLLSTQFSNPFLSHQIQTEEKV